MDSESLRTLRLLNEIGKNGTVTQRALSRRLGIALGLTNLYLKHLVRKGLVRVKNIKKNRLIYELTPTGLAQKASLTFRYLQNSFQLYRRTRMLTQACFDSLKREGCKNIVLCGTGDIAEVAFLSLQESGLNLLAIIDDAATGREFMGYVVMSTSELSKIDFDKIVITTIPSGPELMNKLKVGGVPPVKILFLDFDGI